ncbi:hypothetical protein IFM12275_41900 [Nocardia sputorum]|nr:hypothetical protein IFM12275_41900 [Nocardia sputorum]
MTPFLPGERYPRPGVLEWSLIADVSVSAGGRIVTKRVDLSEPDNEIWEMWRQELGFDPSPEFASVNSFISYMTTLLSNSEGHMWAIERGEHSSWPSYAYTKADLEAVRRTLLRAYKSVTIYGAPDDISEYNNGIFCPYVVAETLEGTLVDSTRMGHGELWFHWLIGTHRLNHGDKSPHLVDEPETYISPRGHRQLMNELIVQSLRNRRQLIIATHSPAMVSSVPTSNIRMCVGRAPNIRVIIPSDFSKVARDLGIERRLSLVVLVEDKAAVDVFEALCSELDPALLAELEVVRAGAEVRLPSRSQTGHHESRKFGGKEAVIAGLNALHSATRVKYVALLDADCKSQSAATVDKALAPERVLFLPGSGSPEGELEQTARRYRTRFAEAINRSVDDVDIALHECESFDHQLWISGISDSLKRPRDSIVEGLVRLWLTDEAIKSQALAIIQKLHTLTASRLNG